jgi:hypothetical protein
MRQICDDWAAICWYSAGPVITVSGRIAAGDYVDILGNQVQAMVQMFPNNDAIFQDGSSPVHTQEMLTLGLRIMKMHFNTFPGQHNRQTSSNRCGQF